MNTRLHAARPTINDVAYLQRMRIAVTQTHRFTALLYSIILLKSGKYQFQVLWMVSATTFVLNRTLRHRAWATSNKPMLGLSQASLPAVIFLEDSRGKRLGDSNAALLLERDCNPALLYPVILTINRLLSPVLCRLWLDSLGNSCTWSIWWTPISCSGVCMDTDNSCTVHWSNQSCHIPMHANWGDQFSYGVQISSYSVTLYVLHQIPLWKHKYHPISLDFIILIVLFIIFSSPVSSVFLNSKMQFGILSIFLAICAAQVLAAPARNGTQNHDDSPSYCLPGCWPKSPDVCPLVSLNW